MAEQFPNPFRRLLSLGFQEGVDERRERLSRLDRQATSEQAAAELRVQKATDKIEAAHRRWKARNEQR